MHVEYFLTLLDFWKFHVNLPVETSGTHQGLVKNIGAVGGCKHDDSAVGAEAVHLGKELIESVFALVIGRPAHILASCASYGVYFIDEHYAGGLFLGLGEEVAYAACTDAHEHLHEIRAADGEERYVGLPCNCLGEQGLACAGRAYKQSTFGNLASECSIFLGILKEIDNLHYLFLRSVKACHILERDID